MPFHVLATQNPIEQEGTYPLPEAQLDRFLLEVEVTYPDEAAERAMLLATTGSQDARPVQALTAAELIAAQALIRRMPVGEGVLDAILRLVRGARPEHSAEPMVRKQLAWGPGPRAAQALMLATRARAVLDGRLAPSIEDVLALARPVLRHRMALNFSARAEGVAGRRRDRDAEGAAWLSPAAGRRARRGATARRGRGARRPAAAAGGRRRPGRRHRAAGRAWPPPGRPGRQPSGNSAPSCRATPLARIDWRQSAKSDRLFIRETEWEAAQTIALWSRRLALDGMGLLGPTAPTKRERADLLPRRSAPLLLRGGERVRLIGGAGRSHAGRAGLTSLVETMTTVGQVARPARRPTTACRGMPGRC